MRKEKVFGTVTPEEIAKAEKSYGTVKVVTLDREVEVIKDAKGKEIENVISEGVSAIFRKPDRSTIKFASNKFMKVDQSIDTISGGEVIFHKCWIIGDKEMEDEDKYFFRACQELNAWLNELMGFTSA